MQSHVAHLCAELEYTQVCQLSPEAHRLAHQVSRYAQEGREEEWIGQS